MQRCASALTPGAHGRYRGGERTAPPDARTAHRPLRDAHDARVAGRQAAHTTLRATTLRGHVRGARIAGATRRLDRQGLAGSHALIVRSATGSNARTAVIELSDYDDGCEGRRRSPER